MNMILPQKKEVILMGSIFVDFIVTVVDYALSEEDT